MTVLAARKFVVLDQIRPLLHEDHRGALLFDRVDFELGWMFRLHDLFLPT